MSRENLKSEKIAKVYFLDNVLTTCAKEGSESSGVRETWTTDMSLFFS